MDRTTMGTPTFPSLRSTACGRERGFVMPRPGGGSWVYTPEEVNSLDQLDYAYDDLLVPAPIRIMDALRLDNALDVDSLQVRIVPHQPVPEQAEITVGRVSIYRQGL